MVIFAFCYVENTIFTLDYFITKFVIPVNMCLVFMSCVAISLGLPIISYFVPVSYERYVKKCPFQRLLHLARLSVLCDR